MESDKERQRTFQALERASFESLSLDKNHLILIAIVQKMFYDR